jgi:hypothetical protein
MLQFLLMPHALLSLQLLSLQLLSLHLLLLLLLPKQLTGVGVLQSRVGGGRMAGCRPPTTCNPGRNPTRHALPIAAGPCSRQHPTFGKYTPYTYTWP